MNYSLEDFLGPSNKPHPINFKHNKDEVNFYGLLQINKC